MGNNAIVLGMEGCFLLGICDIAQILDESYGVLLVSQCKDKKFLFSYFKSVIEDKRTSPHMEILLGLLFRWDCSL